MGQYQNPRYTGTNDPMAFTKAFNASFSMWYDKIFSSLIAGQNQAAKRTAAVLQAKQDYEKKYGKGYFDDLSENVDKALEMNSAMQTTVNGFILKVSDLAGAGQWSQRQMRKAEHQFQSIVTPWNHVAKAFYTKDGINFDELNYGHGDKLDKLKLLKEDMANMTNEEIASLMSFDIAMPGQVLSDEAIAKGVKVGDIFANDIKLSDGTTLSHTELQTILNAANSPENQLSYVTDPIDALMENNIEVTNNNTKDNINEAYKVTPGDPYDEKMNERDQYWKNNVTNTVEGLTRIQLQTLWHNKMETSNIFQEGDIDPNGNPMTAELAERLNLLNFGDVQDAIYEHTTDKKHYSAYGTDDTWEGKDTSGMGITQELSEEDYDLASFVIEAQKGKIADYLANNEEYVKKLDAVKRAKPLTVIEKSLSDAQIEDQDRLELHQYYRSELSPVMTMYQNPDTMTTDDVKIGGTTFRQWLLNKAIRKGTEVRPIESVVINNGILSVKVQAKLDQKGMKLKTLFTYDLTTKSGKGFYDLVSQIVAATHDDEVLGHLSYYRGNTDNPY